MLCDILDLINPSFTSPVLAFIGSKFVYTTVGPFYFFSILDRTVFHVSSFVSLLPLDSYEVNMVVAMVLIRMPASFLVGSI
jgi:hypothetical protein